MIRNGANILKKVISISLIIMILMSFIPNVSKANNTTETYYEYLDDVDFSYTMIGDEFHVMLAPKSENIKKIEIPSTYEGKKVKSLKKVHKQIHSDYDIDPDKVNIDLIVIPNSFEIIEGGALEYLNVKEVELPKTIKKIGDYAIFQSHLEKINLPDSLEEIGQSSFNGNYITSLKIPGKLEEIPIDAFAKNKIENLEIENGVKFIREGAFEYNYLKNIVIPESVEKIEESAFGIQLGKQDLSDLSSITILNKDVELDSAFISYYDRNKLTIYGYANSTAQKYAEDHRIKFVALEEQEKEKNITRNGIKYLLDRTNNKATVIEVTNMAINSRKELNIPSKITSDDKVDFNVTKIASNAVTIDNIEYVTLPETLEQIEDSAFTKYNGNVVIPKNVSKLDINAFSTHEVNIQISDENPYYQVLGTHMGLYNKENNTSILYGFMKNFEEYRNIHTVAESIVEIGDRAFKYCTNFKKIKIGAQVEKIGEGTFEGIEDKITIQGYTGSYAEKYAKDNNIEFESLGELPYFRWSKDNYSFENSDKYFSSYDIGDLEKGFSNALKEYYAENYKDAKWEGSCGGMAETAILFKTGYLNPKNWEESNKNSNYTYDLSAPNENKKLLHLISLYQSLHYFFKQTMFEKIDTADFTYVVDFLRESGDSNSLKYEFSNFYDAVKNYYSENENKVLLCAYQFITNEKTKETERHAVVITDRPEELDIDFYREHGWDFDNNDYYGYRIPIYDVNNSQMQRYIYIKNDFSKISMGDNISIDDDFKVTADEESDNSGRIIEMNVFKLNDSNVFSLEYYIKNGKEYILSGFANSRYIQYNESPIKICDDKGNWAKIEGEYKTEGNLDCEVEKNINDVQSSKNNKKQMNLMLDNNNNYSIEELDDNEKLNANMITGESYMSAQTTAGGKATFENKESVELENPTGNQFETKLTLNDEFVRLPWYTITTSGNRAKKIKTKMTEEGVLVTGDDLSSITIVGNNDTENSRIEINTEKDKVLIKANDTRNVLVAYVDNDNDGTYETKIAEGTTTGKENNNENKEIKDTLANKELPYTGMEAVLIVLIIAAGIMGLISSVKYIKYKKII